MTDTETHQPIPQSPPTDPRGNHSDKAKLKPLIAEGNWAAANTGLGEHYLAPYAHALGASTLSMGLLSSLPFVVSGVAQLFGLRVVERGVSRRAVCRRGVMAQALVWLPIAALVVLPISTTTQVSLLLFFTALYFGFAGLLAPVWTGLVGDIIPPSLRSQFLGWRTTLLTLTSLAAFVVSGLLLEFARRGGWEEYAFIGLFLCAAFARFQCARWFTRYEDPAYLPASTQAFSMREFWVRIEDSNFARFVLFVSMFNFAVSISNVYIPLYLLRDASVSYFQFMLIEGAFLLVQGATFFRWGQLIGAFGAKRILSVTATLFALVPFLFLSSSSFWALLCIRAAMGFIFSGYTLSSSAFLFDAVSPMHRARCAAYQGVLNSVLVLMGAGVGALLASVFQSSAGLAHPYLMTSSSPLVLVFLISGILRLALIPFLSSFKEVRSVAHVPHLEVFFRASLLRPLDSVPLDQPSSRHDSGVQ